MTETPEIIFYRQITIPSGVEIWLDYDDDNNILLESDALRQPKITLYPEFKIEDNNEWIIFRNNKVLKVTEILDEIEIQEVSGDAYPLTYYNNNISYIYKNKNKILFNKNLYLDFNKKYNFFILLGKKHSVLGNKEKMIEIDTPKAYYIGKKHVSISYDNELRVYNKNLTNIKNFKNNYLYLGNTKMGDLFVSENGRLLLKDEFIGICQEAVLLGETKDGFVLKCENKVKVYKDGTLVSIDANVLESASVANNKYIVLTTNNSTTIYTQNLEKNIELKKAKALAMINSVLVFISLNNNLYVLNLERKNNNLIRIVNKRNTKSNPIILELKEDIPYNLSLSSNFIVINKEKDSNKTILKIEPIEFKKTILEAILENDLIKYNAKFEVDSEKPKVNLVEAIIRTARNGKIKNTQFNSELEIKIDIDLPSRLPHEARIDIEGYTSIVGIDDNHKILKIYLNNFNYDKDYKILKIYLNRLNKTIFEIEIPAKVLLVDKPNEYITELINEDRKMIIKKKYLKDIFEWEEVEEKIIEYNDVLVVREGDCINIEGENKELCMKEGFNKFIKKTDNGYKTYYIIAYPNPINDIKCELIDTKIKINVDLKRDAIVKIAYSGYVEFDREALFNLDPFHNKIVVESYIGNLKWEKAYYIDSLKLSLLIAKLHYGKIREVLQTFGIL